MDKWVALRNELLSLMVATLSRECGDPGCKWCVEKANKLLEEYDDAFNERWTTGWYVHTREHP